MKKIKPSILYIIITIIVYLLGFLILLGVDSTSGGSEMFAGLEEALKALFTLSILIPIILFIGGVFLLKNNYKKKQLKRAIIHLLLIIGLLFLITLQYSFYSIFFIVPISVLITDHITKKDDKKTTKRVFIILIILLLLSILFTASRYIAMYLENTNHKQDYTCVDYIASDDNYFYCQAVDGIKRINKNTSQEKNYKGADALFNKYSMNQGDYLNNKNNTNYLYYTIHIDYYNKLEADCELHVINIANGKDTKIKYLRKELIQSAITDDKGNLYFETSDFDSNWKAYYYQINKSVTKVNHKVYEFYYLKDNTIYYYQNREKTNNYYSYNLIDKKLKKCGEIDNDQNITMNSHFSTINNYRYQFYSKQVYKFDINDYSKIEVFDTNQNNRINTVIIDGDKAYLLSINYKEKYLIASFNFNTNIINNINYDLEKIRDNYIIKNDSLYYINSENNYIYKYDINNKKDELYIKENTSKILDIDNTHFYIIVNNKFKAIDLKTKQASFSE